MKFLYRFFISLVLIFASSAGAMSEKVRADPCHGQGRIALMADSGYINPTAKVALKYVSGVEIMFQKGADHALEYDLKYDEVLAAACLSGEPQVISVNSFRLLYGKERFDRFNSDPV